MRTMLIIRNTQKAMGVLAITMFSAIFSDCDHLSLYKCSKILFNGLGTSSDFFVLHLWIWDCPTRFKSVSYYMVTFHRMK